MVKIGTENIVEVAVDATAGNRQVVNIKHPKTMTLDKSNYCAWRVQFQAMLHGNHLMIFVEGDVDFGDPINEQQDQLS